MDKYFCLNTINLVLFFRIWVLRSVKSKADWSGEKGMVISARKPPRKSRRSKDNRMTRRIKLLIDLCTNDRTMSYTLCSLANLIHTRNRHSSFSRADILTSRYIQGTSVGYPLHNQNSPARSANGSFLA